MVDAGKVENIRLNVELKKIKSPETIESDEQMFSYESSAPVDSYSAQDVSSDWNANLTKEYKKLGLKSYTWTEMNGFDDAVLKSQNNFIDLIRMYEGHGNNFKAKTNYKDGLNVSTYGYGLTTTAMKAIGNYKDKKVINPPANQTQAYTQLLKYLNDVSLVETKRYLSEVKYDTLPNGIKAALLDYHFKSGYEVMRKSSLKTKLKTAAESGTSAAWAAVLKELVYAKPSSSKAAKVDDPGIYRRCLSRVILAAADLKNNYSKDAAVIDKAVKEVYENAVACSKANGNKGLNEIEKIYSAYKEKSSAAPKPAKNPNESNGKNQYIVPDNMGVYSAAGAIIPDTLPDGIDSKELRKKVVNEIIKLNNIPTDGVDTNGYPKVDMLEKGMQLIMPDTVTVGNSAKIRLKTPDNWAPASGSAHQSENNGEETDIDNESVRSIELLDEECSGVKYENVGSDKNLKCAVYKYTVQEGNTIYGLAMRYGVDWKTLLDDNNMTTKSVLQIGDEVKINKIVYKVKKGDNLTQIANKYGLTVDYMRDVNNLQNANDLKEGQYLEIPGYVYTVKKGDNLTQIAKNAGIDVNELVKVNGLSSPDKINPGDKLVILINNSDYNISETDKVKSQDDEGNEVTTIKSDNSLLKGRPLLTKKMVKGKCVASREVLQPTASGKLSGRTIIINAGHGYTPSGSMDNGAPGLKGRNAEVFVNYDNAVRVIEKLRKEGAKVIYLQGYEGRSSSGDDLISQELKKSKNKADFFISIHANSSKKAPAADRAEIYYHRDSKSSHGKKLAGLFETKLDKYQGQNSYAETKSCGYQVLRTAKNQNIPAVLWEVAFINNKTGSDRLKDAKLMDKYADMLTESLIEYFNGAEKASAKPANPAPAKNNKSYTVKSGDTLGSIAQKYGTTIADLKKWNNLKGDKIIIGQTLIVKK